MMRGNGEHVVAHTMWRRLDAPGHDVCWLLQTPARWALTGSAIFRHGRLPCMLFYRVECDAGFRTTAARVEGWLGRRRVGLHVVVNARREWRLNGKACPAVRGCIDFDLNFSPSTNLLSVRRLRPGRRERINVRAAWLEFPGFDLQPLEQYYERTGSRTYDYGAPGLKFRSKLVVNRHGFVIEYPPLWTRGDQR